MAIQLGLGFGKGRRVITVWPRRDLGGLNQPVVGNKQRIVDFFQFGPIKPTEPRGDVDYDDQPPNLTEEEDSRQPDRESVEHDREGRDIARLEQEIKGHAKPERQRMAKATLRSEPRGR